MAKAEPVTGSRRDDRLLWWAVIVALGVSALNTAIVLMLVVLSVKGIGR